MNRAEMYAVILGDESSKFGLALSEMVFIAGNLLSICSSICEDILILNTISNPSSLLNERSLIALFL